MIDQFQNSNIDDDLKKELYKSYLLSQIHQKQQYFENFGQILIQGRKQYVADQQQQCDQHLTLKDLMKTLDSMNLCPESDALSSDGLFRFDVLIRYQQFQVAILFFNEQHQSRSQPFQIFKEQQNQIEQLNFRGYKTIGVSVYEWPWKQRRAFKRELFNQWLQKAILQETDDITE
eukprot:TRINITY_DN14718_c0_g1_i2.p1 TRINITY_DN14718_c0_g1~~TRINITY_DN14718_c0_g1_i2.p1  ORF type:complete len:175 (+),score=18.13 TRINITY_DN14718_c0_g1_i2:202-726(+)